MEFHFEHKKIIRNILDESYSASDVQKFLRVCFSLAQPFIHKKLRKENSISTKSGATIGQKFTVIICRTTFQVVPK